MKHAQWILTIVCSAALLSEAENFRFYKSSGDWMNARNWKKRSDSKKPWEDLNGRPLPKENDEVQFGENNPKITLSDDAGTILKLKIGLNGEGGELTLNEGARLVLAENGNFVGKTSPGKLIMNGGKMVCNGFLSIADDADGTFILNDGAVIVKDRFVHNFYKDGGIAITTINGGLLDVNELIIHTGVVDIAGGRVRIHKTSKEEIKQWILKGKLTFYGSSGAEHVHYSLNPIGDEGFEITAISGAKSVG